MACGHSHTHDWCFRSGSGATGAIQHHLSQFHFASSADTLTPVILPPAALSSQSYLSGQLSELLSALCGALACVKMTD